MYEKDKRSFFEKLTGTINIEDEENNMPIGEEEPERIQIRDQEEKSIQIPQENIPTSVSINQYAQEEEKEKEVRKDEEPAVAESYSVTKEEEEEPEIQNKKEEEDEEAKEEDGELAVDIYENENEIFVQAMIAGVEAKDVDVSITRDSVVIKGSRQNMANVPNKNYYNKELYWGKFSRKILLPEEIDAEKSEAIEKHGLLILRMPKLNNKKIQKLEVKAL